MVQPILAPNSTWFSQGNSTITRSSITEIEIVDTYTPTGNETASWDASTALDGSVMVYVNGTKLTIAGNGYGKVFANADSSNVFSGFTSMASFNGADVVDMANATTLQKAFYDCLTLKSLDLNSWDTKNVENLQSTFNGMLGLESISVRNWNTGKVTTMRATFQCCVKLTTLDLTGWTTDQVKTMYGMFSGLTSYGGPMSLSEIIGIEDWNTSLVDTMATMFQQCASLLNLNLAKWNIGSVNNMKAMFSSCASLTTIGDTSNWETTSATDMGGMFYGCTSLKILDVSNWDVSKVKNFSGMFSCSSDYGTTPMIIDTLDVSNWNTSSATDMNSMFYGCKGPGSIDVSGWDVSKVKTFDHMFAHSYLTIGDISKWNVSTECTNLNAIFHTVQNTALDVSGFDTSKVTVFNQMFENCTKLTQIVGLENFDTSSGLGFSEMFQNCSSLPELNLSSFDTTKAKDGAEASGNGSLTITLSYMFNNMPKLEKVTLGENFSFNGDGTTTVPENIGVLPTPSADYIDGADGNWYDLDGNAYVPANIQDRHLETYYASRSAIDADCNKEVVITNGTLMRVARALRQKTGSSQQYYPSEFADAILALN